MPIEKEFKTLPEIKKINSEEKTTQRLRIQNWLRNHRLNSRKKLRLNFNHVTFSRFLTLIPLTLGFSQFLTHRVFARPDESFFEQNLPFFKSFQPKISFETVDYIAKPNYFASVGAADKTKLEPNLDLVEFISQNKNFGKFGHPPFLAKTKKRSLPQTNKGSELPSVPESNQQFTGLSCDSYILSSGNFLSNLSSSQKLSRNLDELPSYLKGLNQDYSLRDPLPFFSSTPDVEKKQTVSKSKLFLGPAPCFKKLNLVKNLESTSQQSVLNLDVEFSGTKLLQDCSKNKFYKDRVDFYDKVKQLNTELENLFLEKNISSFPLDNLESDPKRFQFLEDIRIAEKILSDLEKNQISKESPGFRAMSGYLYPDMTSVEIERLYNSKNKFSLKSGSLFTEKRKLKLESVGFPLFPQTYSFSLTKLPKILVETKNILLKTGENKEVLYNGPSVLVDSQKMFDWTNSYDQQLRSWFHDYLSPTNPLFQSRENFFGNYYSPQFGVNGKLESFSDFRTHSFLRLKLTKTLETNWNSYDWLYNLDSVQSVLVPSNSSFHIPFEREKQNQIPDNSSLRGLFLTLSKTENEEFLPLVQINQPVFTNFSNHGYSSIFEFGRKGNPDYKSSPLLTKLSFGSGLMEDSFITKYTSGQYKKLSSFYTKKNHSNSIYVNNWEPLTANSWLVVSQLSFAVFCFHILKNLADNYGRELLGYLLDLVAALGILDDSLKQQIEILTGQRNKGFRVVLESKKKFHDIVGIQKLLLEIYEVVLFLRNSARNFILSKTLPHGILLIGPPGTGKTLLVQALAGEAQVPVIVLSGSSLIEPGESSPFKLQMVFQEARQLAPCIVFIDEIDTLSAKRNQLIQNPMATDEGFESFLESLILESKISFQTTLNQSKLNLVGSVDEIDGTKKQVEKSSSSHSEQNEKQLSLLSQLLIELDGIQSREGVVVIGATNRPEVLDPALLRPGRFDKIVKVNLPEHNKRVEILQFYGKNLGYQQTIPWNYLGDRTAGFTAADLATLMNESTIKAILNQSSHTIETIEHGINRLTTSESEKYTVLKFNQKNRELENEQNLSISSKLSILRLAYYQAGKIILSYALQTHPKTILASLWPRRPTIRSMQITTNLQNSLFEFARLGEINERLIGCYAGKAAEFLFLEKFSGQFLSQASTLGLDDLVFAQKLVYFMLEDCRFYSKKTHIQKTIRLLPNMNKREFYKNVEKLDMYAKMVDRIQAPPMWEAIEAQTSSIRAKKENQNQAFDLQEQRHYSVPWWQLEVSDELEFKPKNPGNGSRLYLYNSERTYRNPEWLPPDEFYHTSSGLKNTKKAVLVLQKWKNKNYDLQGLSSKKTVSNQGDLEKLKNLRRVYFPWNDISNITRDYSAHSLVLQSFNKALLILNENRELLDRLVIELLYHELLRKPEIETLIKDFELRNNIPSGGKNMFVEDEFSEKNQESFTESFSEKENLIKILENSWGENSRKKIPNWIDFAALKE